MLPLKQPVSETERTFLDFRWAGPNCNLYRFGVWFKVSLSMLGLVIEGRQPEVDRKEGGGLQS